MCKTPPAPLPNTDSNQLVTVAVNNIDEHVVAVCNTDCTFYYRGYATPYLTILQLGSARGRPLDMYGLLHGQTAVCCLSFSDTSFLLLFRLPFQSICLLLLLLLIYLCFDYSLFPVILKPSLYHSFADCCINYCAFYKF